MNARRAGVKDLGKTNAVGCIAVKLNQACKTLIGIQVSLSMNEQAVEVGIFNRVIGKGSLEVHVLDQVGCHSENKLSQSWHR